MPLFLHATRNFGRSLSLGLYAGTILGGRLLVEDENGNKLNEAGFNRAPFVSATLSARFQDSEPRGTKRYVPPALPRARRRARNRRGFV